MDMKTKVWFRTSVTSQRLKRRSHRKAQRKFDSALGHFLRVAEVGVDEDLDAFCAKIE